MDFLGIAQQGLQQAQGVFEQTAQRVAQSGLNTGPPQGSSDSVSLSDDAVSLLSAKNLYEVSLSVTHVADDMQKATLSVMG